MNEITPNIHGTVEPGFEKVRNVFIDLWQDIEVGSGLCIYLEGKPVVNLWGGYTDQAMEKPWEQDTLVNVYSTTKGIAAIAFALLVEDGLCNYDDKVSDYWPEFAAENKQNITIGQLFSHQAGLCGVDQQLSVPDLYDWAKMTNLLAAQKPLWPPGTAVGYHAVTWGYFPGELVRRLTGQSLGTLIKERVTGPSGADFHLGLEDKEFPRCADLIGPNRARKQPEKVSTPAQEPPPFYPIAMLNPSITPFKDACSEEWRRCELAASNGHSTAEAIARIYSDVVCGKLIDEKSLNEATTEVVSGDTADLVTGTHMRRSRGGFILNRDGIYGPNQSSFGHPGAGGSTGFGDPEQKVGFSYVMNQMQADSSATPRSRQLLEAFYRCI